MTCMPPSWAVLRLTIGAVFGTAVMAFTTLASADDVKLRLAYVAADTALPVLVAQDRGAFKAAGIDFEATEVQGGPAVVAAIASGSADVGYAAPVPAINARMNGINVKMFMAPSHEVEPDKVTLWMVASKASGIVDLAGLKGRKIALNANGSVCDLAWRDHLATVGLKMEDVETVVLPFSQQEAALELGSVDAACAANPFYTSIQANSEISPKLLAVGAVADLKKPVIGDAFFATDDFIKKHSDTLRAFSKVVEETRNSLLKNRPALEAAAVQFFNLTPVVAKSLHLPPMIRMGMNVKLEDVQPMIDAMGRVGMLTVKVTSDDVSVDLSK